MGLLLTAYCLLLTAYCLLPPPRCLLKSVTDGFHLNSFGIVTGLPMILAERHQNASI
jgi:hypothetical protein